MSNVTDLVAARITQTLIDQARSLVDEFAQILSDTVKASGEASESSFTASAVLATVEARRDEIAAIIAANIPGHEWSGTLLHLRNTDGSWGAFVDLIGPQGLQGPQGVRGIQGTIGPQGERGEKGNDGDEGPQGPEGVPGTSFTVNATGTLAARGAHDTKDEGFSYLASDTGDLYIRQGAAGSWSDPIPFGKGETGSAGPQGPAGPAGAVGPAGDDGDNGRSAYESALENGFTGSEAQWIISLKGETGDIGPTGATGPAGTTDYNALSNLPTLGTASAEHVGAFATSAQGAKADTAMQPVTDYSNVFPDYDFVAQASFYSGISSGVADFFGTSNANRGKNGLRIYADAAERSVYSDWITVPAGDYYAEASSNMTASGSGSGTASVYIQHGTIDAAGAVTFNAVEDLVVSKTDTTSNTRTGVAFTAASGERAIRARFSRAAGGTADANFGGLLIRKKYGTNNLSDGAATNAKLANVPTATFKARAAAGTGVVEDLTVAQVLDLLNVAPYVATRADLKAIDTTKVAMVFLTEDGRRGPFVWRAVNSATLITADTQEGVVIKANAIASSAGGWYRIFDGAMSIAWFGCIGDDATDNTTAFQGALNYCGALGQSARKSLLVPAGVFRYTTVNIAPGCLGLAFKGLGRRASVLKTTKITAGPAMVIDTIGVSFDDLDIRGSTAAFLAPDPQTIIVQIKRSTVTVADFDVYFTNCYLSDSWYLVESWGRGCCFTNCSMSNARYCTNLNWEADGAYLEDSSWDRKKATGFRRHVYKNCEVHAINVAMVRNLGANAINAQIELDGCYSEVGDGLFMGMLGEGSHINGCRVHGATGVPITITGGERYRIDGGEYMGTLKAGEDGATTVLISLTGQHTGFAIDGATVGRCKEGGIDMRSGDFVGIVRNIDAFEIGLSAPTSYDAVTVIGTGAATEILADGVTLRNASAARSVIRMHTAGSVLKHRGVVPLGAATPATSGAGTISAA